MSNAKDLGVLIENLLSDQGNMQVFAWDDASIPMVGQVVLNLVSHDGEDYARVRVTTSDRKRFIIQVFNEEQ